MNANEIIEIRVDGGTLLVDGQVINIDMEETNNQTLLDGTVDEMNDSAYWSEISTELLIRTYKKYQELLNDPNLRKRTVWAAIANEVGINRASCQKKWTSLLKTYRHKFYNSKKTKRNRWKFFNLIDDIAGKNMDVNKVFLAGSSSGFAFNEPKSSSPSEDETTSKPKTRRKVSVKLECKSSNYLEENSKLQREEVKVNQKLYKCLSRILNETWEKPTSLETWEKEQSAKLTNFFREDLILRRAENKATSDFLATMTKVLKENN